MEVQEKTKKTNSQRIFYVIILLLLAGNGFLIWQLIQTKSRVNTIIIEKDQTLNKNEALEAELDSLLKEHELIKSEYTQLTGTLETKDSIILEKANYIRSLIAKQGDYNKIKKDLKLLREMTQGYVHQLDSLYKENKVLKAENIKIKKDFQTQVEKTDELSKLTDDLNQKVSTASKLKAYKISATPLHVRNIGNKEKPTDKAKKTDNVRICFTLSENKLIESGQKEVFIRIVSPPDNHILTKSESNVFNYNNEYIQYSIKKEVNYTQESQDLCMYYYQSDEYSVGNYTVEIFVDGYRIGTTNFSLN